MIRVSSELVPGKVCGVYGRWSRLYCDPATQDGLAALHGFARALGLGKEWFNDADTRRPFYHVAERMRAGAIARGAHEI